MNEPSIPHPPWLRFKLWLGKPFGYFFVPERHVQVIYRMSQYHDVRGPGIARYNGLTETRGPLISIGARATDFAFTGIISRDKLPMTMRLHTLLFYNPRNSELSIASTLTRLPSTAFSGIAENYFRWVLLRVANHYTAAELMQADVWTQIEQELYEGLVREMGFLGLVPGRQIQILDITLPKTMAERQEQLAQRRANILAGLEYEPEDIRRALVTEVIERMGELPAGDSFVNFGDMLESFVASTQSPVRQTKIVDQPPPPLFSSPQSQTSPPPVADDTESERQSRL